jgi:hypothetical protein
MERQLSELTIHYSDCDDGSLSSLSGDESGYDTSEGSVGFDDEECVATTTPKQEITGKETDGSRKFLNESIPVAATV